jgi:hypothetical protein
MKLKSAYKISIISLILFVGAIFFIELTIRVFFAPNSKFSINIGANKTFHPERGYQLKKNYKEGELSHNSHGILGDEFDLVPNSKGVRILTIGDSVTYAPPNDNYPKYIKQKLKELFPASDIEIIVGAVPGYSSA